MTIKSTNAGSQANDQVAIYIDPALLAKLDAHVAKEGGTRQSFLNDLLRDYDDGDTFLNDTPAPNYDDLLRTHVLTVSD